MRYTIYMILANVLETTSDDCDSRDGDGVAYGILEMKNVVADLIGRACPIATVAVQKTMRLRKARQHKYEHR